MCRFEFHHWEIRKYRIREHCIDILKIGLVTDKYFEMRTSLALYSLANYLLLAQMRHGRKYVNGVFIIRTWKLAIRNVKEPKEWSFWLFMQNLEFYSCNRIIVHKNRILLRSSKFTNSLIDRIMLLHDKLNYITRCGIKRHCKIKSFSDIFLRYI